jgi:hypothetical protein
VPEEVDAVGAAHESRAVHGVRPPLEDRLEQLRKLEGIVFEVGVLNRDHVSRCRLETRPERCTLSAIPHVEDETVDHARLLELREQLVAPVRRAVIDDDDLDREGKGANRPQHGLDRVPLVEGRHDHGKTHPIPRELLLRARVGPPGHYSLNP